MLVVAAQAHEDADVVEQRRDLEQQPVARGEPVLRAQLVEQAHGERRHVLGVAHVVAVALAERRRRGQHLAREVLDPLPLVGAQHVEQQPRAQRRLRHQHGLGLRLEQQLAVDHERGHQRLHLGERQAIRLDQLVVVERHRLLAEREEALARHAARRVRLVVAHHLVGGEARVAAERQEVARLAQRQLAADVLHDVADRAVVEPRALLVAAVPGREVLAHAHRAERVGARVDRLAAAQVGEVGAAAAHLDQAARRRPSSPRGRGAPRAPRDRSGGSPRSRRSPRRRSPRAGARGRGRCRGYWPRGRRSWRPRGSGRRRRSP